MAIFDKRSREHYWLRKSLEGQFVFNFKGTSPQKEHLWGSFKGRLHLFALLVLCSLYEPDDKHLPSSVCGIVGKTQQSSLSPNNVFLPEESAINCGLGGRRVRLLQKQGILNETLSTPTAGDSNVLHDGNESNRFSHMNNCDKKAASCREKKRHFSMTL